MATGLALSESLPPSPRPVTRQMITREESTNNAGSGNVTNPGKADNALNSSTRLEN